MTKDELIKSLTKEQKEAIAKIVRNTSIEGSYIWNGENSVWEENTQETLDNLATFFEKYDPESVLD